jgi:anti-sigma regulatory factor (Ser/Thr protein kinase)
MEDHPVSQHEIEVIAGPEAAASARAAVAGLGVMHLHQRLGDVQLAISEVVTNAVRHGGLRPDIDTVRITVGNGQDTVKITVEQPTAAEGLRVEEPRLGENPGGFGLRLVDQVVDNWGHDPGPPGRVWLEFASSSTSRTSEESDGLYPRL